MTNDNDTDEHGFTAANRAAAGALYWRHVVARFSARAHTDLLYAAVLNQVDPPTQWTRDTLKNNAAESLRVLLAIECEALNWVSETMIEALVTSKAPEELLEEAMQKSINELRNIATACISAFDRKMAETFESLAKLSRLENPMLSIVPMQQIDSFLREFSDTAEMLADVKAGRGVPTPGLSKAPAVEIHPVDIDDPEAMAALPEPVRQAFEMLYGRKS